MIYYWQSQYLSRCTCKLVTQHPYLEAVLHNYPSFKKIGNLNVPCSRFKWFERFWESTKPTTLCLFNSFLTSSDIDLLNHFLLPDFFLSSYFFSVSVLLLIFISRTPDPMFTPWTFFPVNVLLNILNIHVLVFILDIWKESLV